MLLSRKEEKIHLKYYTVFIGKNPTYKWTYVFVQGPIVRSFHCECQCLEMSRKTEVIFCQGRASVDHDFYKHGKSKGKRAQISISETAALTKTNSQFSKIFVRHPVSAWKHGDGRSYLYNQEKIEETANLRENWGWRGTNHDEIWTKEGVHREQQNPSLCWTQCRLLDTMDAGKKPKLKMFVTSH